MGRTFEISKIASAPKAFLGFANRINKLIKAVDVISKMRGDGNINVAVSDDNIVFSLGRSLGGGAEGDITNSLGVGALVLFPSSPDDIKVTWGAVGGKVPDNVEIDFKFTAQRDVWLQIKMQTELPYAVIEATIKAPSTGMPEPEMPDPETGSPPDKVYFLLGTVLFDAGEISGILNTNGPFGGSLNVTLVKTGTVCRPAVEADPEADPPVLASDGGLIDILTWKVERQ